MDALRGAVVDNAADAATSKEQNAVVVLFDKRSERAETPFRVC